MIKNLLKRSIFCVILMFAMGTSIIGCAKKSQENEKEAHNKAAFSSEDYTEPAFWSYIKVYRTDRGSYWIDPHDNGIRYYDNEAKRTIFLCNKPDCLHDGNKYCVATNANYQYSDLVIYNGRLLCSAIEETETQLVFSIMEIALDGSFADVLFTYASVEKAGFNGAYATMVIHRNRALMCMSLRGETEMEDAYRYSAMIVNLENGEAANLDGKLFAKENNKRFGVGAMGDSIYYTKFISRKVSELYAYCPANGEEQKCNVNRGYWGNISQLGDRFYHMPYGRYVEFYTPATDEKETIGFDFSKDLEINEYYIGPGVKYHSDINSIVLDENCIYEILPYYVEWEATGEQENFVKVRIFDHSAQLIREVEIFPKLPIAQMENIHVPNSGNNTIMDEFSMSLALSGNDCYFLICDPNYVIYHCKFDELLYGNPEFEIIADMRK